MECIASTRTLESTIRPMAALERRQEMYEEGDSVMALWPPNSSWYPAVITSITKGKSLIKYCVRYTDDGITRSLFEHQLAHQTSGFQSDTSRCVNPNTNCRDDDDPQAIFQSDPSRSVNPNTSSWDDDDPQAIFQSDPSSCVNPNTSACDDDDPQAMLETGELHQSNEAVGCETNDSSEKCAVTVMQTDNVGRQRKWDKKHYCFYCDEPQAKLPRHLQSRHKEEREVVEIASETDVSARKKLLLYIRNIGNHRHNCQVLREGKGVLIIVYRPNHEASPHAYGPCIHCYGYYVRLDLWRHQCPLKPALPAQTDGSSRRGRVRGRVANKSDLLKPPPAGVSFQLNKVLSSMRRDNVGLIVKNDSLILEVAKREYLRLGHDVTQHGYIRNKLRELGRLVIQLRQNTHQPNASLEVFVHPRHLNDIVKAVHDVAGFSEGKQMYHVPSLALKIGHSIKRCALILQASALEFNLRQKAEQAEQFRQLCEIKWPELVSTHAHRTLYQGKRNKPADLPTNADVVKISSFLHETGNREVQLLHSAKGHEITPAWKKLNEVTLCHLIIFNRRRQGEVSKMKLEDFQKRSSAAIVNGDCVMTDLERHLCKMFKVIEIVGKRGRTVPVLLGTDVMAWLKALVANRNAAGVAQDNIFLFARSCYGGSGHIRGSDCLRAYANQAGLENADSMRSTKLRKHVATVSQILALNEHQLETLADFMGHDLRVHREYYRLPDTVQRVTKLSRLFLSLERGNLVSQHGKSLEELHVTGEGFSSDEDSSDSGDSCDPALEDSVDDRRPPTQTDPAPKDRQVKRRQFKRRPWTAQEKKDVTEGLQRFFLLKKMPGKRDIESSCPVALQTRTWRNIKDFCRNTMTLQQI